MIEELQRKPKVDLGHISCIFSNRIPPRNLIVRGCFVLEMVSFRLEVVTSSIQLAMVSGQVTTIYVYGYNQDQDQDRDLDDDHDNDPDQWLCVVLCVLLIKTIIIHRWFLGNFRNCLAPRLLTGFSLSFLKVWLNLTVWPSINPQPVAGPGGRLRFLDLFPFLWTTLDDVEDGRKNCKPRKKDVIILF